MSTCPACGQSIESGLQRCPHCGVRQDDTAASAHRSPQTQSKFGAKLAGCGCLTTGAAFIVALFLPQIQGAREAANRTACKQNLKQIGLALRAYHEAYGSFPPAYVADESGRLMHSWRVLVLPFLDEECQALHAEYHFDEPWDGPRNRKLIDRRPDVFKCPTRGSAVCRGCTSYVAAFGPECVFRGSEPVNLGEISDGASHTLMVAEISEVEVPWAKPEDVDVKQHPKIGDRQGISSDHVGGLQGLFADGSVQFINETLPQATIDALLTRDGHDAAGYF